MPRLSEQRRRKDAAMIASDINWPSLVLPLKRWTRTAAGLRDEMQTGVLFDPPKPGELVKIYAGTMYDVFDLSKPADFTYATPMEAVEDGWEVD